MCGVDEYTALAERVAAGVGDVHGCLILSRDGMVLGAHPDGDEAAAKPAWLRFATLGEARKGFVEFGDQLWVYVHRGPYAAFAVASAAVRPGLLMDQLEQALLSAEEARTRREPLKLADVPAALSGKPRASLHPSSERSISSIPAAASPAAARSTPAAVSTPAADSSDERPDPDPPPTRNDLPTPVDEGAEVDPVLLAKEFSGLLQVDRDGDEASS